jgi:tmRNA-binding protein
LRERKLLLHKQEIKRLTGKLAERDLLFATNLHKKCKVKLELGPCKGKNNTTNAKQSRRDMKRICKGNKKVYVT